MRIRGFTATTALLVMATITHATLASELSGTWQVDVSKLPVPQPPKSVTLVLSELGQGMIRITIDVVGSDGATSHSESNINTDGTAAKVVGSLDVDTVSVTLPNQRTLIMGAAMGGHPSNTRVFALEDSRHMTESIVSHGNDGVPHTRVNFWTRK
jgi:hypothetical protein